MPPRTGEGGAEAEPPRARRAAGALALLVLLCLGCSQAADPSASEEAWLELRLLGGAERSFRPPELEILTYRLEARGPSGLSAAKEASGPSLSLELAPGAWSIAVDGLSASGLALARGGLELRLEPGERRSESLLLLPVEGAGSLSLSWTVRGEIGPESRVEGCLRAAGEPEIPLSSPAGLGLLSLPSLAAGAYLLELGLFDGEGRICGLADSVLVLAGQETRVELSFAPPEASLVFALLEPDFLGPELAILPPRRRVRPGLAASFSLPSWAGEGSWFLEGQALSESGKVLSLGLAEPGKRRIDWVGAASALPLASGQAELRVEEAVSLGPLDWAETLERLDLQGFPAARALDDCRDLAISSDGRLLAAAAKEGGAVGIFAWPGPGGLEPLGCLASVAEPRLESPGKLRFLPPGEELLVLSEAAGALYRVALEEGGRAPRLIGETRAAELLGAADLALSPGGETAYIAAPAAEALLRFDTAGGSPGLVRAAGKGDPGLELLSKPLCLALSRDGALLALGSGGDDAVYVFNRDCGSGALALRERISKESLSAFASLSDPLALAFSPDGLSLFVLSYFGKALIRLDRAGPGEAFLPTAAAKSGSGGVLGFDYPRRIALSPGGELLLLSATGAADGLSAFAVAGLGELGYLGTLAPDGSAGRLGKPYPLAFSPDGLSLFAASAEEDRLAAYRRLP